MGEEPPLFLCIIKQPRHTRAHTVKPHNMRVLPLVAVLFYFCVSTLVHGQTYTLTHNGTGRCHYKGVGGNVYLDIPEDLEVVPSCTNCADIFGTFTNGACQLSPCDGMLCFESTYRLSYVARDQCGFEGVIQVNCDTCDTPCMETCSIYTQANRVEEEKFVECGFDLTYIGYTTSTLCSGSISDPYCDDAKAAGRTCYVAKFSRDDDLEPTPALQFGNCAPIFSRVHDEYDYWACPMDSPVSGRVEIYDTPYCDDFAQNYGDPISDGYTGDGTIDGGVNNAGSKLSSVIAETYFALCIDSDLTTESYTKHQIKLIEKTRFMFEETIGKFVFFLNTIGKGLEALDTVGKGVFDLMVFLSRE